MCVSVCVRELRQYMRMNVSQYVIELYVCVNVGQYVTELHVCVCV
jgi:hypothetical protein